MTEDPLAAMRRRYDRPSLRESELASAPHEQFARWMGDAVRAGLAEPNAMVLSTVHDGRPRSRHVLLKHADADGFVFYTNLSSDKARDIATVPDVSLCFPWFPMQRQVIVTGSTSPVSHEEAAAYWHTRPRESQIGAWASSQSTVIESRADLEAVAAKVEEQFPDEVPLPDFWGGYRVAPDTVEFWQGGPGRLHDRLRYRRARDSSQPGSSQFADGWEIDRLAP